jgi:hypothetical protein
VLCTTGSGGFWSRGVLIIYPSQSREIPNREGIPCTFDDEGPDEAESFL